MYDLTPLRVASHLPPLAINASLSDIAGLRLHRGPTITEENISWNDGMTGSISTMADIRPLYLVASATLQVPNITSMGSCCLFSVMTLRLVIVRQAQYCTIGRFETPPPAHFTCGKHGSPFVPAPG
jgi:hypothetical protein